MQVIQVQKQQSFRERLSWKIAYTLKPLYFFLRRKKKAWTVTMETMEAMPAHSLGNDVARFLKRYELNIMPRAEWHDVYHVLFGYETNIRDEACIQFIPLGNGRWSLPYVACTLVSLLFYPEFRGDFYAAFKRGRSANRFHDWDFEPLLQLPTAEVRKMIFEQKG